ncbi:MAG: aminotransferase class III-fold pyridoxal phosphate-dependent enzyme [Dehalococcoidia bacterium]|nr:aminotransferase class III-fold pyridoxal phosphate-dependent enzyme [Dehalococcoidia bacterium]
MTTARRSAPTRWPPPPASPPCATSWTTTCHRRPHSAPTDLTSKIRGLEDRLPAVTGVRGKGLLLAIGLSSDIAPDVVAACRERGLLVNNVRPNAVRLMPPLTVSEEELDRACQVLEESINAVAGS